MVLLMDVLARMAGGLRRNSGVSKLRRLSTAGGLGRCCLHASQETLALATGFSSSGIKQMTTAMREGQEQWVGVAPSTGLSASFWRYSAASTHTRIPGVLAFDYSASPLPVFVPSLVSPGSQRKVCSAGSVFSPRVTCAQLRSGVVVICDAWPAGPCGCLPALQSGLCNNSRSLDLACCCGTRVVLSTCCCCCWVQLPLRLRSG